LADLPDNFELAELVHRCGGQTAKAKTFPRTDAGASRRVKKAMVPGKGSGVNESSGRIVT
jgi:hypothetical protein